MAKSNSEYWIDRGTQNIKKADRYAQNQADLITRWFKRATKEMTDKVNEYYKKYADKNGISIKDAKAALNDPKLLNTTLEEYYALVDKYIDDPETKALLDKIGYARSINREEFLKLQLNTILSDLYFKYDELTTDTLTKSFEETYYKEIFDQQQFEGIGSSFQRISTNQVLAAVTTNWSGKNYSERVWDNQRASLARRVNRIVTTGMITGRSVKEMRQDLEKEMNTSTYNARRLIRTECNYVTGQARLRAYNENGTKQYQFLAVLDLRTSEICRSLDFKIFDVDKARVGVNMNPMHPHCRSTTVPYVPDEEFDSDETRVARGHDGAVYKVPANMKYEDWYNKYVKGVPEAELHETMLKHIYGDNAQFKKYKGLLGKGMPKTLEEFQKLKYTDSEAWSRLKWDYGFTNRYTAKNSSEMLPEYLNAADINKKLTSYSLNPEHETGKHKARVFESALGYNQNNVNKLEQEIKKGLSKFKATGKTETAYGTKFTVKMLIKGADGNMQPVITAWQIDKEKSNPRMVTAYVDTDNKRP